ncbi:TOMM precursor leader peptide-binding protein [Streptomyces oceani]|uniref:YcaO domain-containing protein n=1 Tax=Streptomyces oceani TaxID=1075402 RepID=A0A1E7KJS0_9ACTN|nr:TOMM precursor leader peptide-binding protein [Streptomyces oceani]OEV04094.1 hypothetical protein AN216_07635 [Streptomyces oceani]
MAAVYESLADTRPRIRRDVLFTETPGGVLFHNADGGFHLTGRTAYRFASLMVPHLAGQHRLAEICAGFGPAQQRMAAELVRTLYERGFARDIPEADDSPETLLDAPVASRFAAQIGYVDHYTDAAPARFRAFRETRVAILGTDETARWCALSLVRNGCGRIGLPQAAEVSAEVTAEAAELAEEGCPVRLDRLPATADWSALTEYDVVVVTGAEAAADTYRLLAAGVPEGRTLLPAWTFGQRAVTGPLHRAGGAGCLGCALLRLGDNVDEGHAAELWSAVAGAALPHGDASGPLFGPVAAMTGNLLGYEIFRITTGALPAETDQHILLQDLRSLDVLAEPVRPHPRCRLCVGNTPVDAAAELDPVLTDGPTLPVSPSVDTAREAEDTVELLDGLSGRLVRAHTGEFTRYDDEDLTQTPLKISRVELPLGPGARRTVCAFDVHHLAGARMRALRAAAVLHAEHVRPVTEASVVGTSLLTKERLTVEAAVARPVGRYHRERQPPAGSAGVGGGTGVGGAVGTGGSGAGTDVREAVGEALLAALSQEALLRAVRGAGVATLVPLDAAAEEPAAPADPAGEEATVDPELVFLARSARHLGVPVELLDLGEAAHSGAHVVLAREADQTAEAGAGRWATGAALSRTEAVTGALRDLLGQVQLTAERPDVDLGDPLLPELHPATIVAADFQSGEGAEPEPRTDFPRILERLRAADRDVLVLPTTPPGLRAGGLSTARVLLTARADGGAHDGH